MFEIIKTVEYGIVELLSKYILKVKLRTLNSKKACFLKKMKKISLNFHLRNFGYLVN